ncbi:hypothetical protein AX16_004819 [Volvariella volvacea WC 439]|nr:hypothetical protein AX16_004819 [Volvariella volvacea WC 439]
MDSDVQRHSAIFDVVDNLVTLNDTYMDQGGQVENWSEFWGRAQLELLNLSRRLDDAGYGLPMRSDKDKKSNKGKNGFQMAREKRNGKVKQEVTPQMLLEELESTATAPWVTMFPEHDEDRLLLAHSRLYQVFRYLAWPKTDPEDVERDYVDFTEASAGSDLDPDIARGRKAVAIIMRSVVDCLSTIPADSQIRIKYRTVFDILGPLMVLRNKYLTDEDGRVENWTKFWGVAHDAFFSLRLSLKKAGFNERPKNKGEPNIQTAS